MNEERIPRATAKRLPLYYRHLNLLYNQGKIRISSKELSESIKVDSATIRKDFSYFGELGRKGYGYDIAHLLQFFRNLLDQDEVASVALVGVGNLGTALLHYNFMKKGNTQIEIAFDTNREKVGEKIGDVPVYHVDDLEKELKRKEIKVVILTVPARAAQEVTSQLVENGVEGILNFTPSRLSVPSHVRVHHIDLSIELQTLIYFLKHN
ncbi:redox-sensing transcriptional repressor Rex [Tenuibacillus multivorans]|uniref:Redox-sensing transcriptional repressor Rex n=1 Tax=Tenuibacillus multivorans TaxID=237069 RepID=A0A1H0E4L4_9BACI|nr:redox-sensing transcriptional repressor Rex [Tenuibacillus multivorans]GEL76657.1 redox-sensing transcriptional repressor Rex [Tenuibacillus multivorans]SDN77243.1 redox-sensing transcriptional repressor [Tenuibacillus multivorans]